MRFLLIKASLQFKLLKELYPKKFEGINSLYNPKVTIKMFECDFATILWISLPIYFKYKSFTNSPNEKIKNLNIQLLRNNKKIYISLLLAILWWFGGLMLFYLI